ncbi:hypothetical protein, partial [Cupriavidus necator]|uniref:hypothetical protein n=1 Tax=Cupriavidus necator TaxID=106590 RepID=UPI0030F44E9C
MTGHNHRNTQQGELEGAVASPLPLEELAQRLPISPGSRSPHGPRVLPLFAKSSQSARSHMTGTLPIGGAQVERSRAEIREVENAHCGHFWND